jgi:FHA domain
MKSPFVILTAFTENDKYEFHQLEKFPVTLGRGYEADVCIDAVSVSRLHLRFALNSAKQLLIESLSTTSGTYYKGMKIDELLLTPGVYSINLGRTELAFELLERDDLQDDDQAWFYLPDSNNQFDGKFTESEIMQMIEHGKIGKNTLLRHQRKIFKVAGIEHYLNGVSGENEVIGDNAEGEIICPHCWWRFNYENLLYIAENPALTGDQILGEDAGARFTPSSFNVRGQALDSLGTVATRHACPNCHLYLPEVVLQKNNDEVIISVVGPPSSGKSFLLTSMMWELRNTLGSDFGYSISDADPVCNKILIEYEDTFFSNNDQNAIVTLRKTEEQGELYNEVKLDENYFQLPTPFFFNVKALGHTRRNRLAKDKTFVLYDNAGESFQPGKDITLNLSTRHLAHSDIIFFLFDPLQDPRIRKTLLGNADRKIAGADHVCRQDIYISELVNRLRKNNTSYKNLFEKTLVITVPKFDAWQELLTCDLPETPWRPGANGIAELDYGVICSVSLGVRNFIEQFNPAVVHNAEAFFANVIYIPVSAIGKNSSLQTVGNGVGVKVADIDPYWITVPFLHAMMEQGLLDCHEVEATGSYKKVVSVAHDGKFCTAFGGKNYTLSKFYLNRVLTCPETSKRFMITAPKEDIKEKRPAVDDEIGSLLDEFAG